VLLAGLCVSLLANYAASRGAEVLSSGRAFRLVQRITSPRPSLTGYFGGTVALADHLMLIGERGAGRDDYGAAWAYERYRGGWRLRQEVIDPEPQANSSFGFVDYDGRTAVIGAPGRTVEGKVYAGAAYVFHDAGGRFRLEAKLTPPASRAEALFGLSVGIDGDTVAIGAPGLDEASGPGAVYMFERRGRGWQLVRTLTPPVVAPAVWEDRKGFGRLVRLEADTLVVQGLLRAPGAWRRCLYVFQRRNERWDYLQTVVPERPYASISNAGLSGQTMLVPVETTTDNTRPELPSALRVLSYRSGYWWLDEELSLAFGEPIQFGMAALDGDLGAVVCYRAYGQLNGVCVYERTPGGWQFVELLDTPAVSLVDSVAVRGGTIVNGAHFGGDETWAGAVYVFERREADECVCRSASTKAPAAAVEDALAHPTKYGGWMEPANPSLRPGPSNPPRKCLSLVDPGKPYHELWNSLVWRAGCRG
jgi:hypothetical protein